MSFFQALLDDTRAAREQLSRRPALQRALEGQVSHHAYIAFLTEAYHHVRHTVPLLMACGARLPARLEWLRSAVAEYIHEETGHQEWVLADIAAGGGDAEAVRNGTPAPATELMVAYAYDTVQRRNPVGMFGMVLVLEGTSVHLACRAADALQRALGLPDEAFTYLRSHGSLDETHMQTLAGLLNRLDEPRDQEAVRHAAHMFYRLYGAIFDSLPLTGDLPGRNVA